MIDEGIINGLDWTKYNIKFIFSAEAFSEKFRDYIAKNSGIKDIYSLTLNHYGTVDQGTIAHETPLSVLIRRLAIPKPELYQSIFSSTCKLPTLAQYLPEMFYFEDIKGKIICSTFSGIPLVRYDLKDNGGVVSFEQMKNIFDNHGIDLEKEIDKADIRKKVMNLPFVYVYERADLSVSLSGANVYPETVKKVLISEDFEDCVTGRFTMLVKSDKKLNPYLEINVELKPGLKTMEKLDKVISKNIERALLEENSEYKVIHGIMKKRAIPKVIFWDHGHEKYFRQGGKQKWVIK